MLTESRSVSCLLGLTLQGGKDIMPLPVARNCDVNQNNGGTGYCEASGGQSWAPSTSVINCYSKPEIQEDPSRFQMAPAQGPTYRGWPRPREEWGYSELSVGSPWQSFCPGRWYGRGVILVVNYRLPPSSLGRSINFTCFKLICISLAITWGNIIPPNCTVWGGAAPWSEWSWEPAKRTFISFFPTWMLVPLCSQRRIGCEVLTALVITQAVLGVKNPPAAGDTRERGLNPWVRKIPWRRKWQPTPVSLPGKSHGQRSLVDYVHGVAKSWMWLSTCYWPLLRALGAQFIRERAKLWGK